MKAILSALLLTITSFVFSQDFEVAPVVLNFTANPGEIQQATVTIRNHANIKQGYTFNFGDFKIDAEGNKKRMPAGTSSRSCANWITVNPSFIELNPNEEREVTVIMTVPKDGNSSRWGMIYVQASDEQSENPVDKQFPEDSLKTFNVTVTNTGDKIIEANVGLVLANLETAAEQKFPTSMMRVYPGEKRTFTLTLPNNLGSGKHALAAILDYGHGTNLEGTQLLIDL